MNDHYAVLSETIVQQLEAQYTTTFKQIPLEELECLLDHQIAFMPSGMIAEHPGFYIIRLATAMVSVPIQSNQQEFDILVCNGEAVQVTAIALPNGFTNITDCVQGEVLAILDDLGITVPIGNNEVLLTAEQLLDLVDPTFLGVTINRYVDMNGTPVNEVVFNTTIRIDTTVLEAITLPMSDMLTIPGTTDELTTETTRPLLTFLCEQQAGAFIKAPRLFKTT